MSLPVAMQRRAQALVARRLGLDFPERREADLERAFVRACRDSGTGTPDRYLALLETLPAESGEWRRLAGYLTVGETYFFRDAAFFDALEHELLPALVAARREQGALRLRLWSAGCSTGEEPYSLAIVLDRLLPDREAWALTILGTDVNSDALAAARRGIYRPWSLRDTPPWVRARYFRERRDGLYELDPDVRSMVSFAPLNLAEAVYPTPATNTGAMDAIVCRNVIMYLTDDVRRATVTRLAHALVPGGWLFVTAAEAWPELLRPLHPVEVRGAVFHRKEPFAHAPRPAPSAPPIPALTPAPAVGLRGRQAEAPHRAAPPAAAEPEVAAPLERAREHADTGNLEEARRLCEAAVARARLDPEPYLLLAAVCQEQADLPGALEALRAAIYLAPDSAAAHFLLGTVLLARGNAAQGLRHLETVTRLLGSVAPDEPVPGADGLAAGRLLEIAQASLRSR